MKGGWGKVVVCSTGFEVLNVVPRLGANRVLLAQKRRPSASNRPLAINPLIHVQCWSGCLGAGLPRSAQGNSAIDGALTGALPRPRDDLAAVLPQGASRTAWLHVTLGARAALEAGEAPARIAAWHPTFAIAKEMDGDRWVPLRPSRWLAAPRFCPEGCRFPESAAAGLALPIQPAEPLRCLRFSLNACGWVP